MPLDRLSDNNVKGLNDDDGDFGDDLFFVLSLDQLYGHGGAECP